MSFEAPPPCKRPTLSFGVTTHEINLLSATRDRFDDLGPHAGRCGEIACISKRDGRLDRAASSLRPA